MPSGSIQAIEVLKEVLGVGESLSGNLLMYDALNTSFHKVRVKPDPECRCAAATRPSPTSRSMRAHHEPDFPSGHFRLEVSTASTTPWSWRAPPWPTNRKATLFFTGRALLALKAG